MIDSVPPGCLLIFGGLLIPLLRGRSRSTYMLLLPALGFLQLLVLSHGDLLEVSIFDYSLTPVRVDRLSLVFGYIFHIAAFLGMIFALRVKDTGQHVAAFVYAGSAIGAVFAGDLITLFVYWELAAISSVFLIWARRSERSYRPVTGPKLDSTARFTTIAARSKRSVLTLPSREFDRAENTYRTVVVGAWVAG